MEIGRYSRKEKAEHVAQRLNEVAGGKTFFNFDFAACPDGGEFSVCTMNVPEDREDEAMGMLANILADAL